MTTLADLVAAQPAATSGVPTGFVYGAGEWRHVLELADPGVGSAVAWHDVTGIPGLFTGYEYNRGSDGYQGRYRASVATLDFYAKSDALAPWNPDNSAIFGTHIELGPGLLIRSGFIRVSGGVVNAWNPRFTNKVDSWGDASFSRGKVRQHRVSARDTLSSFVGVPLPARPAENWFERLVHLIADSGWPYGWFVYGARHHSDGTTPIMLLPERPASTSAINEIDTTLDPVGLIWYTNRSGQLIVRPRVNDTFHAAAFAAGADGTPWVDPPPVHFAWWACQGGPPGAYPGSNHAAYAVDTPGVEPFGFDKNDRGVINHVKVSDPVSPGFDDDDPVSIQRFDRRTMQASWLAANDTVAADLLTLRANATVEARPLNTNIRLENFHPGPANIEFCDDVEIVHRNNDEGMEVFGSGWLRSYTEQVRPLGCDTDWSLTFLVDIYATSARSTFLKPVEDLMLAGVSDTAAVFSWTNPPQDIAPTHTQCRLLNPASLWQTTDYPLTGITWSGLTPTTAYEFQVRLIRMVDGITTHFSATRSLNFTTEVPSVPFVDGDDIHLPPADTGCSMGWELQSSTTGGDPWSLVDSGFDDTEPFVIPDYPMGTLDPDLFYRVVTAEDCGLGPGPDVIGDTFVVACTNGDRLSVSPYNDPNLVAYWPEVCSVDINELVSGEPMIKGFAYKGYSIVDGVGVLVSGSEGLVGYQVIAAPPGDSHQTISCRVNIGTQPASEQIVFAYGGMWISIVADQVGTDPEGRGFRAIGNVGQTGSGVTTIESAVIHGLDTVYELRLTHDQNGLGDLRLYVDGVEEAQEFPGFGDRTGFGMEMHLPANSWVTDCAAWDKVLTPTAPVVPPTHIVGQYVLPQQTGPGNDPFLTGPMVMGRTLMTLQWSSSSGATPELWKINLDNPGVNNGAAAVTKIATSGGALTSAEVSGVASGGYMWAGLSGPYRVARIHVTTGAVAGTVAVINPYHILGTPEWVYNSDGTNFVTRIDPSGPTIVQTSPNLASGAGVLCLDEANDILWSLSNFRLVGLDPMTLAVVKTMINLPTAGLNHSPSVDASGTYLYAVDTANGSIYRVTIATMAVTTFPAVIPTNSNHEESPSVVIGDKLYAWHKWVENTTQDVLAKVDLTTMTLDTAITGMLDPHFGAHIGTHWDGTNLWLLGRNVTGGNNPDALLALSTGELRGKRYTLGTNTPVGGGAVSEVVSAYGGQIVHTFIHSGTSNGGFSMQLVPVAGIAPPDHVDFLIVGGGGGGGSANTGNTSCGGGGGGEVAEYFNQAPFIGAATTIVVGNGGGSATTGTDTTIKRAGSSTPDYEAWGGAGGGVFANGGVSGHWASGSGACGTGFSSGTSGRGHDGRGGGSGAGWGGGGGGAGAPGFPTPPGTSPRNGGDGKGSLMLDGTLRYYGGGGGGGGTIGTGSHTGGLGGGGSTMSDAAANTGGGGGAAQNNFPVENGRAGGYGAFILRYPGEL